MPAAFTSTPSVQVWGFDDRCRLTRCDRLLCDSCSSGQCFACGFLQIPPRGGHPCRPASGSPCRVHRGLTPPSHPVSTTWTGTAPSRRYAPCLAHNENGALKAPFQIADEPRFFRGSLRLDVLNSGGDGSSPIFATGLPIGQISQFPAPFPNLALQAWYPKGFEP